ncbi:GNAT family N-acetyltransferase [Amnibacterium setariae]|uniref:N-acetyltransferase n=1 Tax=Amnibacterium setariae TaxID=2306585 RepID=A0A3A1U438_9MICO|nr:GNAT family N-acetyltransferase [Amnibacterium setariae]RIX31090.1 N-acetyltransferase [Amnibacterium setariae]
MTDSSMTPTRRGRVVVRRFAEADLPDFLAYQGHPAVREHQQGTTMTPAQAAEFVAEQVRLRSDERDAWHGQVIEHIGDRRVIGDLGLWRPAENGGPVVGDLGFQLDPAYHGHGYAREAVQALLHVAFLDLGVDLVTASCDEANARSWGLLERIGMQLQNRSSQERRYALTKEQWRTNASRDR